VPPRSDASKVLSDRAAELGENGDALASGALELRPRGVPGLPRTSSPPPCRNFDSTVGKESTKIRPRRALLARDGGCASGMLGEMTGDRATVESYQSLRRPVPAGPAA